MSDNENHPVLRSHAPWTTKSECYSLFLSLKSLPEGIYDPLEAGDGGCLGEEKGEFQGGLGAIMIVRYSETPVGSYDEVMIIPGNFTVPQPAQGRTTPPKLPQKALRIARIYVSQRTTVYNGRKNWNIAKHLARFEFSHPPTPAGSSPPESLTVKVFPAGTKAGDGVGPFFNCTLTPFKWLPKVSVSTRWLPVSTMMAQPPLPAAAGFKEAVEEELEASTKIDEYDISPRYETALLTGTDRWFAFPIEGEFPRTRACWVKIHPAGEGVEGSQNEAVKDAGRYWPQDAQPWSVGAWMEDAEMTIPGPLEWKL